jgi:hypothetical protein
MAILNSISIFIEESAVKGDLKLLFWLRSK